MRLTKHQRHWQKRLEKARFKWLRKAASNVISGSPAGASAPQSLRVRHARRAASRSI